MTLETLESLQLQYDTKMKEYNQLTQDYKQALKAGGSQYVQLKDKAYFGVSFLKISQEKTIDTCQASCSSNPKCSGATYVPTTKNCTLSTGTGSGIRTTPGSYAILTRLMYISGALEEVNKQLIILNNKIKMAVQSQPNNNLDNVVNKNNKLHNILMTDYKDLASQRRQINKLILDYDNVNGNMQDTSLVVNQQMLHYRLYTIILALILCLIVMVFGGMSISMMIVPLIIAAILFILNMSLFSFIIVCGVVLYYIYSIPMP
jgi:hypothetical protein